MNNTYISEIMTRHVTCATADNTLDEIVTIMIDKAYSSVVIHENKKPVGIITERDIIRVLGSHKEDLQQLSVRDFMSEHLITVQESDKLMQVLELSANKHIKHFPIINQLDELEGLVTQTDLVKYFLQTSHQPTVTEQQAQELMANNAELQAMALQDPLLCIGNRRAMEIELERVHSHFLRYGSEYIVVLFDVDFFKNYNDHSGHIEGDRTLRRVADLMSSTLRKTDYLFRYGGEELLLLLPNTDVENGLLVSSRMCEALVNMQLPHPGSPLKIVTVSGGLAQCNHSKKETLDWRFIVSEADDALYMAKENGRNRIEAQV